MGDNIAASRTDEFNKNIANDRTILVNTEEPIAILVSLELTYVTELFNLRPLKAKRSNVWDVDILFRYLDRLGDNIVLTNIITETGFSVITT